MADNSNPFLPIDTSKFFPGSPKHGSDEALRAAYFYAELDAARELSAQEQRDQYNRECQSIQLVGGPSDGGTIRVHPMTNTAVPWKHQDGHLYQYRGGKAYHIGRAPAGH